MFDAFISYRRSGGAETARLIYDNLSRLGINTFFDIEELKAGQFNKELYTAIEDSNNFIVILPPNSLDRCQDEDDWLRLEIVHAIKNNKNIIPLMMKDFEWPKKLPADMQTLQTYHGVNYNYEYLNATLSKLLSMLKGVQVKDGKVVKAYSEERQQNLSFKYDDIKERRRLKIQQNILKKFDKETYEKAINSYDRLRILDLGSNTGDFIMDRLGHSDKIDKLIGLEYDKSSVDASNKNYAVQNKINFFSVDVESDVLEDLIDQILMEQNMDNFNIIHISMLLLHLKNPYKLLKRIRKYLSNDGMIIIKDIDDGYNIAYPDDGGEFAKAIALCNIDPYAGYRQSGRQIYTQLSRSGYKNIKLEKCGLTTIGMDYDERSALFDTYFSFIVNEIEILSKENPNDRMLAADNEWFQKNYDLLEEKFQDESLFFSLGFMLFTAYKK